MGFCEYSNEHLGFSTGERSLSAWCYSMETQSVARGQRVSCDTAVCWL